MNLTIRRLDEVVFRKFKAKAAEEGMKLGQALTQAMEAWIRQSPRSKSTKLTDMETSDWGKGSEKTSLDINEILYGEKS